MTIKCKYCNNKSNNGHMYVQWYCNEACFNMDKEFNEQVRDDSISWKYTKQVGLQVDGSIVLTKEFVDDMNKTMTRINSMRRKENLANLKEELEVLEIKYQKLLDDTTFSFNLPKGMFEEECDKE